MPRAAGCAALPCELGGGCPAGGSRTHKTSTCGTLRLGSPRCRNRGQQAVPQGRHGRVWHGNEWLTHLPPLRPRRLRRRTWTPPQPLGGGPPQPGTMRQRVEGTPFTARFYLRRPEFGGTCRRQGAVGKSLPSKFRQLTPTGASRADYISVMEIPPGAKWQSLALAAHALRLERTAQKDAGHCRELEMEMLLGSGRARWVKFLVRARPAGMRSAAVANAQIETGRKRVHRRDRPARADALATTVSHACDR